MDYSKVKVTAKMATQWARAKECALATSGKSMVNLPDDEWERKLLACEHSPIRMVEYDIRIEGVPQWVTVHIVRHFLGCEKFVHTQRTDRNSSIGCDRDDLPQGEINDMTFVANAQALINISKRRLCRQASPETRFVWGKVRDAIAEVDPVMARFMVPMCVYWGMCGEPEPCGYAMTDGYDKERRSWYELHCPKR